MEFAWGCQKRQKEGNGALEQHVLIYPVRLLGGCGCSAAAGACGVSAEPAQSSRPGTAKQPAEHRLYLIENLLGQELVLLKLCEAVLPKISYGTCPTEV